MKIDLNSLNTQNLVACYSHAVLTADHYLFMCSTLLDAKEPVPEKYHEMVDTALDTLRECFELVIERGYVCMMPLLSELRMYDHHNEPDEAVDPRVFYDMLSCPKKLAASQSKKIDDLCAAHSALRLVSDGYKSDDQ